MKLDERIRDELEREVAAVDAVDYDEAGLFRMLRRVFTGGLRRWAAYGMFLTLIFFGLTVWCGVQAVTADTVDDRIVWLLGALFAFQATGMLKLWFFMEMNRNSVLREVKRVEVELARLRAREVGE